MREYSRLIEIFEDLVEFKTISGNHPETARLLDYAVAICEKAGLHVSRYSSNGFESIVATTRKTKKPKIILQAHIDVVPAAADMFKLRGQATKLVGRGAFDMKYAAACYLRLVEELGTSCADYDFGIMLTSDEEVDGLNGTDYLLDRGYSGEVCLLPDGGDDWKIESSAKGIWRFDVIAEGVSAHASRPWIGKNAANKLIRFIDDANHLASSDDHTAATMVLSRLESGEAPNQVPDRAVATFDVRFFSEKELQALEKKVEALAKKHDVFVKHTRRLAALEVDVSIPAIKNWEATVAKVRGKPPAGYGLSYGASDAGYFADRGIPTIVTRPKGGGHHGDDEWIDESGLYQFYNCLGQYIRTHSK